jgi:predicted  nucleic acid-binding Zn-ribbon protein
METKLIVKTEKIEKDILDVLVKNNAQIDDIVSDIGSLHIRRKELESELNSLDNRVIQLEDAFKESNTRITETLRKLEVKYPSGRINLGEGTLTFTIEDSNE